jgi:hypothetical protein
MDAVDEDIAGRKCVQWLICLAIGAGIGIWLYHDIWGLFGL